MGMEHHRCRPPLRVATLDPYLIRLAPTSAASPPFLASRSPAAVVLHRVPIGSGAPPLDLLDL